MPARNPEEICSLFKQYMAEDDIEGVLSLHDPEVVFLNQAGQTRRGKQELKQELVPFAAVKARFDFNIAQVVQSGDIALMHTQWTVLGLNKYPYMQSRSHGGKRTAVGAG